MPRPKRWRWRAPWALSSRGVKTRWNRGSSLALQPLWWVAPVPELAWGSEGFIHQRASQGVTTKAIAKDSNMPRLALIGIGLMYGPIKPLTKAMGNSAAITVSVAKIVGPPTSSTAPGISSARVLPGNNCWCRWMFSTTTMASSTKMPMEKIRANKDTRFKVKPQAQEANSVAVSVKITAAPTIAASRRPNARNTKATTEAVANSSF